ncbi:MAG: succinyl-diaminopimelate desuccinylase [Propionibacteriaceae bacterium]|nr:succinyl-diaminopimelate desuccinylase [Propionibacteriaceae bacterium]
MLDILGDLKDLVAGLVDIESVSGHERVLADHIESGLEHYEHLDVTRLGNTIVARTNFSAPTRILIAGHLDTVPVADNVPSVVETRQGREVVMGRGAVDMKGGIAVQLNLAASITHAPRDMTWIFYDCEEIEASRNGLGRLAEVRPELLSGNMAILMEPTDGAIEAGCQGTIRMEVHTRGVAAHSARSWTGHNAIHDMSRALEILNSGIPQEVDIDGLTYREGLNAVEISGGIAGNVIPDRCVLHVNYRFAPHRTQAQAVDFLRDQFAGYPIEVTDSAPGALPGLNDPILTSFVESVGSVHPKYGWTDVSRFAELGIPAVNYGPGDPNLAHTDEEYVFVDQVMGCRDTLQRWLTS